MFVFVLFVVVCRVHCLVSVMYYKLPSYSVATTVDVQSVATVAS